MKKKVLAVLMVAALSVGVVAGCGAKEEAPAASAPATDAPAADAPAAADEYVLKCGSTTPDTHPYNLGIVRLSELLQEKTDGAARVDMFGSSQLGGERDLIEGLQLGTVEMCVISTAPLSGFTDAFLVFDLPFIFATNEQARATMDSEVGTEILNSVTEQGLIGVCWFENGFRNISNNVRPINTPEDVKGLKIRTMENQMHMACFQIMGADPTPMAMGEVFTACQQGTIDGQENPVPIIESNKLDEVQKYVSLTGHLFSPAPVFVGQMYYDTLPADVQTAILEAGKEAVAYQREQIDAQNESGAAIMAERTGCQVNTVDKAPFQAATAPLYDEWVKDEPGKVSPEIYARVMEVVKAN